MNKERTEGEGLVYITMPMCDRTVNHETSGEFIIPDYQPELRRLLSVREKVLPPAKYVSGKGVECNGTVDYTILYVGADGGIYSMSVSSEYEFGIPLDNISDFELSEGSSVLLRTECEGISARVTSPRKISIKSRLLSHVRAYGRMRLDDGCADTEGMQRLQGQTENSEIYATGSDVIDVETEINGMGDDVRVVCADANVFIKNVRISDSAIIAEGDVNLCMLICREDGELRPIHKKIGFEGEADKSQWADGGRCRVMGTVTDVTVNIEEGRIICNISLVLDALTVCDRTVKYTADAYSTDRECECDTATFAIPENLVCLNGNFSQSERMPVVDSNIPEGARIIDSHGSVTFKDCESADGKYIFTGTVKYYVLYEKEGEYGVCELELPVKYALEGASSNKYAFDALGDIIDCRVRTEGDTLAIDSEISVCADIFREDSADIVREIRQGDPLEKGRSRMVVYFPTEGEGQWDVAKKYRVPVENLTAEKNYYVL
ncbi:MAG: hypothetical protein E7607_09145 [Ruminococcaceae bacterium]|nr:hypothetical protein [Oscillospiraceae bacterium]